MADVQAQAAPRPAPASYTLEQLQGFIDQGRSVNAGARGIVSIKEHLPPAHELAGGDPAKQEQAVEELEQERARLDARIQAAIEAREQAARDAAERLAEADRKAAEARANPPAEPDGGKGK